jgi:hypothetical protein
MSNPFADLPFLFWAIPLGILLIALGGRFLFAWREYTRP